METFTAPFFIPMLLGMTYDARTSKPGVAIFDSKFVNDPVITPVKQMTSSYKMVTSSKDIGEGLDVSGDMALKVKTGMIEVEGKGSYLKNRDDRRYTIEMLLTTKYVASVHSMKADAKPRDNWEDLFSPRVLGTHYAVGITHGLEMFASLRFRCFNSSNVEKVKGAVNSVFGKSGSGNQLVAEGDLEKVQKKVAGSANLEISYYGTLPLKSIPNSIEGVRKLVTTFKEQVKEANLEDGIPMEVKFESLGNIANAENRNKFDFEKNKVLVDNLADLEEKLDDAKEARADLNAWSKECPYHMEVEYEKEVGKLIRNITLLIEVFYDVIWKMDLTKGPEQLKPAFDAYDYDGKPVYNRYHKLVTRLIQKLNPLIKRDEAAGEPYIQWGNNKCTANNTQVLYEGFACSSTEEGIGGTAQYICAPKSPQKGYEIDNDKEKSHLAGMRYTRLDDSLGLFKGDNAKRISEKGVTCAKCYSPDSASVVMFSATESCPITWEMMYSGYLMSSRVGGHTTQYVCVDDTPAAGYAMEAEASGKDTMALTVIHSSGSLPSDTYVNSAVIRCVVCAMKSNQITF